MADKTQITVPGITASIASGDGIESVKLVTDTIAELVMKSGELVGLVAEQNIQLTNLVNTMKDFVATGGLVVETIGGRNSTSSPDAPRGNVENARSGSVPDFVGAVTPTTDRVPNIPSGAPVEDQEPIQPLGKLQQAKQAWEAGSGAFKSAKNAGSLGEVVESLGGMSRAGTAGGAAGAAAVLGTTLGAAIATYAMASEAGEKYFQDEMAGMAAGYSGEGILSEAYIKTQEDKLKSSILAATDLRISGQQASKIYESANSAGLKGGTFESAVGFQTKMLVDYGIDSAVSLSMFTEKVRSGSMTVEQLEKQMAVLQETASNADYSLKDMIASQEALGNLTYGAGKTTGQTEAEGSRLTNYLVSAIGSGESTMRFAQAALSSVEGRLAPGALAGLGTKETADALAGQLFSEFHGDDQQRIMSAKSSEQLQQWMLADPGGFQMRMDSKFPGANVKQIADILFGLYHKNTNEAYIDFSKTEMTQNLGIEFDKAYDEFEIKEDDKWYDKLDKAVYGSGAAAGRWLGIKPERFYAENNMLAPRRGDRALSSPLFGYGDELDKTKELDQVFSDFVGYAEKNKIPFDTSMKNELMPIMQEAYRGVNPEFITIDEFNKSISESEEFKNMVNQSIDVSVSFDPNTYELIAKTIQKDMKKSARDTKRGDA